ncbi:GntR family transcriptional regulator [Enterovirga sp. CN4-39]|uniref:GntR family transcriptional regulator n=1 Tax=Enterovirga sp. CN4-39 TaxID=3400910 RepID=UPI003BFD785B
MDRDDQGAGPVPLYHRLYLVLRQQIEEGRFPAEMPLPGELEISKQHGVSRITVRRTMEMLTADGLIERRRGRGTFARTGALGTPITGQLSGLADNLSSYAEFTAVTLHSFEYIPASPMVAATLEIGEGESVQKAVRTRSREGVPVSLLTTHVPAGLGRTYSRDELASGSLIRLLERGGARVDSADSTITAKLADAFSAPLLGIQVGQPLIALTRTVRDERRRPIEYLSALYRPDQYEVRLSMSRDGTGSPNLWRYEHKAQV